MTKAHINVLTILWQGKDWRQETKEAAAILRGELMMAGTGREAAEVVRDGQVLAVS